MAHGIMENDGMISVRETPWHGLGVVLPEHPTVQEAQEASGLTWSVSLRPAGFTGTDGVFHAIPNQFAIVRDDINLGLGVATNRYEPLQNAEAWDFIDGFIGNTQSKIETAGSLWNGKKTWILVKAGDTEFIPGDQFSNYFFFYNGFDASTAIGVMFTRVRVVCQNTFNLALGDSANRWTIPHLKGAADRLRVVSQLILAEHDYQARLAEAMGKLVRFPVVQPKTLLDELYPAKLVVSETEEKKVNISEIQRLKKIDNIVELFETGAGTDIPGVRGTGYGLLQAIGEYADHCKLMIHGKDVDPSENRMKSVLWGTASKMKQDAYDFLMKKAA